MKITNSASPVEATAGTISKGDVLIGIKPLKKGDGISIVLESRVKSLYGDKILEAVRNKLEELEVSDIRVEIKDEAALEYVLNARLETAIRRAFKVGRQ